MMNDSHYAFEKLNPDELCLAVQDNKWIILPIGSIEWHSYHLGFGVDTLHAYEVAKRVSKKIDGIVYPPIFCGTECKRSPESLKKLGLPEKDNVWGMDFPSNTIKSQYWKSSAFKELIDNYIVLTVNMGFKRIILLNGHGSYAQKSILNELAEERSNLEIKVKSFFCMTKECGYGLGHAGLVETAVMLRICPEMVNLNKLPPKPVPLYYYQYGIADSGAIGKDHKVIYDPRDATAEMGEEILSKEVEYIYKMVIEG